MAEIVNYIQANWVPWLFAIIGTILGYIVKKLKQQQAEAEASEKKRREDNKALSDGVRSLLRENIVANYNKYQDRQYCPIYAKESVKQVYAAYHNLGGNDVATELYHKLLVMPEEPQKEREE